jgi:membrane protease YdiL (CAAX protease family)
LNTLHEGSASRLRRWWWTGPPTVYLASLAMLILSQVAGQIAGTFFSYAALQFIVFLLPIIVAVFYVRVVENVGFWSSTGFSRSPWLKIAAFTLALYFLSFALSISLFSVGEYLTPRLPETVRYDPSALHTAFKGLPRAAYWYMVFTSVVYAGFGEELIFRGYMLTRMLRRGRLVAVLASALTWSSLHLWYLPTLGSTGIWQHIDVVLTGLLFGVAYLRMGSILPLIAVHALTDLLLPLSFLFPSGVVDFAAFVLLILGLLASSGLLLYWIYRQFFRHRRSSGMKDQPPTLEPP